MGGILGRENATPKAPISDTYTAEDATFDALSSDKLTGNRIYSMTMAGNAYRLFKEIFKKDNLEGPDYREIYSYTYNPNCTNDYNNHRERLDGKVYFNEDLRNKLGMPDDNCDGVKNNHVHVGNVSKRTAYTCNQIVENFYIAQKIAVEAGMDNGKTFKLIYSCDNDPHNKYVALINTHTLK